MLVVGTTVTLSLTLLSDNVAEEGASIQPLAGSIYYRLPTWPGHWLPNSVSH